MLGFLRSFLPWCTSARAECALVCERGLVRKDNQDSVFVDARRGIFCLADGMGGGFEGGTASRIVCKTMAKAAKARDLRRRVKSVGAALGEANASIRRYAKDAGARVMGTTFAALFLDEPGSCRAAACQVGDSRIYRIRNGVAEPLMRDHTIGGQLSRSAKGDLATRLRSRDNPLAHVLTRSIGVEEKVVAEWRRFDVRRGDVFLVCSDGVHDVVADGFIGMLPAGGRSPEAMAEMLKAEVVRLGAPDNYSFVLVRPEVGP